MKIADAAPNEARLIEISERLSSMLANSELPADDRPILDLDPSYLQSARELLVKLSERPRWVSHGGVELTEQQVETHLEFSPAFLDTAKAMLSDFIKRTEARRTTR
jgi:hypothetical protein